MTRKGSRHHYRAMVFRRIVVSARPFCANGVNPKRVKK
jgi:hypothetical protein